MFPIGSRAAERSCRDKAGQPEGPLGMMQFPAIEQAPATVPSLTIGASFILNAASRPELAAGC